MLPQANRLRRWQDFKTVYDRGIRRSTPNLSLRALRRGDGEPTRIGISIGRKVSKKATIRNRIKRQLRAILRGLLPRLQPGWDAIVGVRPAAISCNYGQFLQELEELLANAEVLTHGHSRGNLL